MPRFVHPDTNHAIETAIPREAAELRSQGYRVEIFDPTSKTAEEVLEYLNRTDVSQEEASRVLAAEEGGKARKSVLSWTAPEAQSAGTPAGDGAPADA